MTRYRMLEYVREQPEAVTRTLHGVELKLDELASLIARTQPRRMVVAGFGSSYTAAQIAAPVFRHYAPVPTTVTVASDIGLDPSIKVDRDTLAFLVSRSGERGLLSAAVDRLRAAGATCVAITGAPDSLLARQSDLVISTSEGPEAAYPKTKSVAAAAAALIRVALALDPVRGPDWTRTTEALSGVPAQLRVAGAKSEEVLQDLGGWLAEHRNILVCGTGGNFGVAHEGALKVQETAGLASAWDNSGDALHGALGVLDPSWLVVGLATTNDIDLHRRLFELVGQFDGHRLSVVPAGLALSGLADVIIEVPSAGDVFVQPLLALSSVQLLAYYAALARGLDPDQPTFADKMLAAMLPAGRNEPDWPAQRADMPTIPPALLHNGTR